MLIKPKHKYGIRIPKAYETDFKTYLLFKVQEHLMSYVLLRKSYFLFKNKQISYKDLISNLKLKDSEIFFEYEVELLVRHLIIDKHQSFWRSVIEYFNKQVDAYYFDWLSKKYMLNSKKHKPLQLKRIDL